VVLDNVAGLPMDDGSFQRPTAGVVWVCLTLASDKLTVFINTKFLVAWPERQRPKLGHWQPIGSKGIGKPPDRLLALSGSNVGTLQPFDEISLG
jgi:hypothetical protein